MAKINEKVLQRIFDIIVEHCEWVKKELDRNLSILDFNRYVVGAKYALEIALGLDYESCHLIDVFFDQKIDEYFEGDKQ